MFKRIHIFNKHFNSYRINPIQKIYVKICSKPELTTIPNLKLRLL